MTWSIIARDEKTGAVGLAVASKFFAVGAVCPFLKSGAGAISTQSLVNPYLGVWGLAMLERGMAAPATIEALVSCDPGRETRQLHGIDWRGENSAYTGSSCVPWAGHLVRHGVSVAGNMLAGERVVGDTLTAYLDHSDKPLAERLLRAMDAGERAGGDKRGRQGAALKIVHKEEYAELDLRVDDSTDAVAELWRLYSVAQERFVERMKLMPTREDTVGVYDFDKLNSILDEHLKTREVHDFSEFWEHPTRPA